MWKVRNRSKHSNIRVALYGGGTIDQNFSKCNYARPHVRLPLPTFSAPFANSESNPHTNQPDYSDAHVKAYIGKSVACSCIQQKQIKPITLLIKQSYTAWMMSLYKKEMQQNYKRPNAAQKVSVQNMGMKKRYGLSKNPQTQKYLLSMKYVFKWQENVTYITKLNASLNEGKTQQHINGKQKEANMNDAN